MAGSPCGLVWVLLPFALGLLGGARLKAGPMWRTSMLIWLTLPPLVVLVSSFVLGPAYVDRYLSGCVPAYLLLVVAGLISLPRPGLRAAFSGLLLLAMAISTLCILSGQRFPKPNWRGAVAHVLEETESDDRLFADAKGLFVTFYYADHALPIVSLQMQEATAKLDEAICQGGRIWFLYRDPIETSHALDRARRFDPYTSGRTEIAAWLRDHAGQIRQEWFLNGVYLALVEPADCGGGTSSGGEDTHE